jgi:hypothetical protein
MTTKADFISDAYSWLRISGLTKQPSAEDNVLALNRLESMAEEFFGNNIDVNYNFEDSPDSSSLHNVERKYWTAFGTNLAVRLAPDFGITPLPSLVVQQQHGYSYLSARTAVVNRTQYPSRMPRGSGTTLRSNRWRRYYRPLPIAPNDATTNRMYIGDINDYVEHFDSYLNDGETISSYTIEANDGLTIVSDSLSSPDISYQIQADGSSETSSDSYLQVKIVATTSDSRVETRIINFQLFDSEI